MTRRSTKLAFSLDERLFEQIESLRAKTGESRSALISRALVRLTRDEARDLAIRHYIETYRDHPESAEDIEGARAQTRKVLSSLAWDEE
mgnify:CR=1 FL=1